MATSRRPTGRVSFGRSLPHYNAPPRRVRQFDETSQTALGRKRRAATRQAVEASFARHKYRQKRLPRQHAAGATHKVLLPPVSEQHPLVTAKAAPTLKEKPKLGGPTKLTPEPGSKKGKAPTGEHVEPPPGKRRYKRKATRKRSSAPLITDPGGPSTATIIGGFMALVLAGLLIMSPNTGQVLTDLGNGISSIIRALWGKSSGG